ncbi:MAG: DUF2259 domain-containing protein [Rhizobiaceae bacterium]
MNRLILFLLPLLWLILTSIPIEAATTTKSHVLGFSKDGRYFVFEEFAVYDGAGIPKATLYVIDTKNDSWLKGTPVRTNRTEEDTPGDATKPYAQIAREQIASVRKEIRVKAKGLLASIGPLVAGVKRVHRTVYDFSAKPRILRFSTLDYIQTIKSPTNQEMWRLELEGIDFKARKDCYNLTDKMKGFRLRLTDERTKKSRIIAEDKRIPKSRPCPIENRIEEIITYPIDRANVVLVVLIRFAHPGFEGADGSLLAVTARIKN